MKTKVSPKIQRQNDALMAKLKKKGHKVKVKYKYAERDPDGIYIDSPKKSVHPPEKPIIDVTGFLKDYAALCVKHLKGVEKQHRTLAMCQIEDYSHVFINEVKPTVMAALNWDMK